MANSPVARPAKQTRTDAFTFILHWGLVAAVVLSLLTGLRIAADYDGSAAGAISSKLGWLLPKGAVIEWHIWSSWALTFIAISYAAFVWRARQAHRVKVDRSTWKRIRLAWRHGSFWSDAPAWFAANVLVYQVGFLLIALMALSGWMQYGGLNFGLTPYAIATVHGLLAYAFLLYIAGHVFAQVKAGAFWKIFRPRLDHGLAAGLAVIMAGMAVTGFLLVDRVAFTDLRVVSVGIPPALDGAPDDPAWARTRAVDVRTGRAANYPNGEVTVTLKAVHDGERAYFRFRWPDPERSQKHLPLIKREDGWHVLQSEFDINDEDDFYEDKFAVLLARSPTLASGTVHLGQDLVSGPHLPITRGLHFTEDGSLVDMWHWKSVRTGGMQPAHMDDNYFGPLMEPQAGVRYTGGYTQDPKTAGGYTLNWTKLLPDRPLGETPVVPRFLPTDAALLERIGSPDLDPAASDQGSWYFRRDEVVDYDPALDVYPIGTILPGVVVDGAFSGDRGDLLAGAAWRDGYWTLEVSRALDTGSKFDLPLTTGEPVYLWVAVFNHTQTRHSQHLHPVRLVLE